MQKKIIALAVAGIMAAPMAAQAGVEVYGKARISAGIISDDNPTTTLEDSKLSVQSHSSRLGFKGSEDLNNGMKAIYQFETAIALDQGDLGISGTRNAVVGLKGDFGKVVIGRHDTPYKKATKDIFGDTHADYTKAVINGDHDTRWDNSIGFYSKDMNGFKLGVAISTDTADDELADTAADDDMDGTSIALSYASGDLSGSLAVQSIAQGAAADKEGTKFGLNYMMNATTFGFIYENTESATTDQDVIYFSVNHKMGDMTLKAAIGQKDESTTGGKDGGDYLAVGVSKSMAANTEVYAQFAQVSNDTSGTNHLYHISSGFNDKTNSAFSVGINMNFSSM